MGFELDIFMGHPEHDMLFIASQVARAAGLRHPSQSVAAFKSVKACTMRLGIGDLHEVYNKTIDLPKDMSGKQYQNKTALLDEANTYRMLLRGNAPQSEPFRKWVTEVVLPSIRKTGKFDVTEATDETSQQYAGEFAALHAKINGLEAMLKELLGRPVAGAAEPSPYEGTTMSSLSDNLLFDRRTFREVGESIGLVRPGIDKLEPYVLLAP